MFAQYTLKSCYRRHDLSSKFAAWIVVTYKHIAPLTVKLDQSWSEMDLHPLLVKVTQTCFKVIAGFFKFILSLYYIEYYSYMVTT